MRLEAKLRLTASADFLPKRLIMLDCEMTGLNPKQDDVLQVAALKLELVGTQYVSTDEFNVFVHTDAQPNSEFALQHMAEVYRKSNRSNIGYAELKALLTRWLQLGQWLGQVSPCGDCVPTDVLFLWEKGVIDLSRYDGDVPIPGTFHFEYFEAHPLKMVARHLVGYAFDKELPRIPGDHNAMVDCRNQLTELNAILKALLS